MQADPGENSRYCDPNLINKVPPTLDEKIYQEIENHLGKKNKIEVSYNIKNTHRAVGTRLSHYIYKKNYLKLLVLSLLNRKFLSILL